MSDEIKIDDFSFKIIVGLARVGVEVIRVGLSGIKVDEKQITIEDAENAYKVFLATEKVQCLKGIFE